MHDKKLKKHWNYVDFSTLAFLGLSVNMRPQPGIRMEEVWLGLTETEKRDRILWFSIPFNERCHECDRSKRRLLATR